MVARMRDWCAKQSKGPRKRKNGLLRRKCSSQLHGGTIQLYWRLSAHRQESMFSRHGLPELCTRRCPSRTRGSRECRVRAAPAVSCASCTKKCAHEHTGSAEAIRHSLRNGFTAYTALSPASEFVLSPSLPA